MGKNRMSEGIYTILKLALEKAKDRTNGINIMTLVEKPKHERVRGRALTKDEIDAILKAARNETERDIIKFYIYTGCRAGELINTLVEFINLSGESRIITNLKNKSKSVPDMTLLPNEVLIYGTKTKGSIRTMPIMPPLKPVLERLIANRDGKEKLFRKYTYAMIRDFHKLIKEKTKISFTLKDFRHTAATSFKDAGIPSSVYFRWFGWCDETMSRRVYTHETEYEKILSQEWAQKFH
jgi:integrase